MVASVLRVVPTDEPLSWRRASRRKVVSLGMKHHDAEAGVVFDLIDKPARPV
jgi:hypothetical protein